MFASFLGLFIWSVQGNSVTVCYNLGIVQSSQGTILNIAYVRMTKNSNNNHFLFLSKL